MAERPKYIPNEATTLSKVEDPMALFLESTTTLIKECPPSLPFKSSLMGNPYLGLFVGPTSIAYFFFLVSKAHPELLIEEKSAIEWSEAYLSLGQDKATLNHTGDPMTDTGCGIISEYYSYNAIRAIVTQDLTFVQKIVEALSENKTGPEWNEWLYGRAGALYLLRIVRKYCPQSADLVNTAIGRIIDHMLAHQPWQWYGKYYIGPGHGVIGNITHIILSDPSRASVLHDKLASLLDAQREDGNWPAAIDGERTLVQWCHGAPGFVTSLVVLRPYFPDLQHRIDAAIKKGREHTWQYGLLTKEPNICHGITSNALVFEPERRDHFLSFATPEKIRKGIEDDTFKKEDEAFGLMWGEAGRAWVWMQVADGIENIRVVGYTDV